MMCMTAEEIKVRYEGERRRRDTALMDAYEELDELKKGDSIEDSKAVENLILGEGIIPHTLDTAKEDNRDSNVEEIRFGESPTAQDEKVQADFLLLNQGLTPGGSTAFKAKMEWSKYEGLSDALQTCSEGETPIDHESKNLTESAETVMTALSPFLDAWDEYAAMDAVDTEMVKLFDFTI